jgi:multidrug resistance efflux pump
MPNRTTNSPDVRSEMVSEFISTKPPWMVRRGISLFFLIVVALIACTWFIHYPETVTGFAKIQTSNPPTEVLSKVSGKLVKLLKKDGAAIQKGEVFGYMESIANHEEVVRLSTILKQLKSLTDNARLEELPNYWEGQETNFSSLGELQNAHQNFMQSLLTFKNYLSTGFYASKKQMLRKDLETVQKLYGTLLQQKGLQEQDLAIAQRNYNMNDTLHNENLINDFEMRSQKSILIGKKMSVPQMASSLIGNQSQQNAINKEMMELDNKIVEQKNIFVQALYTYSSMVMEWESKYLLIAPATGTLSFSTFFEENQLLVTNKPNCYITNESTQYWAELSIPVSSINKVKNKMEVSLKFAGYAYQQFGSVKGTIEQIKKMPMDSGYLAKVILPNGLVTNYKKVISFNNSLTANAEIIVEDKRLLETIFGGLLKGIR